MSMRILHVSNSAYASLADTGPSLPIYRELAQGADAYHVFARNSENRFAHERSGNLTLHLVPGLGSSKSFLALAYLMVPVARRHRLNAIVVQDPLLGGLAAIHTGRLLELPTLLELHTDVYFRMARSRRLDERLAGRLAFRALRGATRVRVGSRNLAPLLEGVGVAAERIVHVPYRVDLSLFDPVGADRPSARAEFDLGDGPVFVSVGRFVPQKGYGPLLEAFVAVAERHPSARLVLAGGGPLRTEYEAAIARLQLGDAVQLRDWISREEQVRLLAAADVYLQPSVPGHGEWMPRTILEAMGMGVPVVASDMAGIPDVVAHRRTGILVAPGDREELAAALLELAYDPAARAAMGDAARADTESLYEWNSAFSRYRELIRSLQLAPGR
jgi:glycosyltransferase involved in cell wall biosynthesis